MNWRIIFQVIGLLLGLVGAIILAMPFIRIEQDLDDDLIIRDRRKGNKYFYTRKGFLKDRKSGLWGLGLLGSSFIIQFFLIIL